MKRLIALTAVTLGLAGVTAAHAEDFSINAPLGLPPVPIPTDNAMTKEKVELGKLLYFDKRLSKDNTISCASCHSPKTGWADPMPTSQGVGGQFGDRNSPTVINSAYASTQFWDGRAANLEEQALGPIENPVEMAHSLDVCVKQLSALPEYKKRFQDAFGTDINKEGIAKAIAAFERTVVSGDSRYDKYMAGDKSALSEQEKRGMDLFTGRALCSTCHTPPIFSNFNFVNAGIGMDKAEPDVGRMKITNNPADRGAFKVPRLRDIADTGPYFHDGSRKTLEEAVGVMAGGGLDNANLNPIFLAVRSQKLTDQDQKDLVAFLRTLSGNYPRVEEPKLP